MSEISVNLVTEPKPGQLNEAAAVCIRAFKDDPSILAMAGGDPSLLDMLFSAIFRAAICEGQFFVASHSSGAVCWRWHLVPARSGYLLDRTLGFEEFQETLSPETRKWWAENYKIPMNAWLDGILGPQAKLKSYWLNILATDPNFRKMGVARKLVETVFDQASGTDARFAVCPTDKANVVFYEKVGFRVRGEMEMATNSGDLKITLMTRDA